MALKYLYDYLKDIGEDTNLRYLPLGANFEEIEHAAATPPKALVIGRQPEYMILAYLVRHKDRSPLIRYAIKSCESGNSKMMNADDVVQYREDMFELRPLAGESKAEKTCLSCVLKFFLLEKEWPDVVFESGYEVFAKYFVPALHLASREYLHTPGGDGRPGSPPEKRPRDMLKWGSAWSFLRDSNETTIMDDESVGDPKDVTIAETKQGSPDEGPGASDARSGQQASEDAGDSPSFDSKSRVTYVKIKEYMERQNSSYLLENLPPAHLLSFVAQDDDPSAQPHKLFIGRYAKSGRRIYAYLHKKGHKIEVNCATVDPAKGTYVHVSISSLKKHRIIHPFNKITGNRNPNSMSHYRNSVASIIKWYFIASGKATTEVFHNISNSANVMLQALRDIEESMGSDSAKPPRPQFSTGEDQDYVSDLDDPPEEGEKANVALENHSSGKGGQEDNVVQGVYVPNEGVSSSSIDRNVSSVADESTNRTSVGESMSQGKEQQQQQEEAQGELQEELQEEPQDELQEEPQEELQEGPQDEPQEELHHDPQEEPQEPQEPQSSTGSASPRGRKRSAGDAGFEELELLDKQDRELTKEINETDESLEILLHQVDTLTRHAEKLRGERNNVIKLRRLIEKHVPKRRRGESGNEQ